MKRVSTKEKILAAALDLFSERGYDGVSVDQIAEYIGIKGPSLYKHYSGKEAILNALIDQVEGYYEANFGRGSSQQPIPDSAEELLAMSRGQILFTIQDPTIVKVRRLLSQSQFRNARIAEVTTLHHLTGLQNRYTEIFRGMMEKGIMQSYDPMMLALEYTAPATLLIQMSDREPEKREEIAARIQEYHKHFVDVYCNR